MTKIFNKKKTTKVDIHDKHYYYNWKSKRIKEDGDSHFELDLIPIRLLNLYAEKLLKVKNIPKEQENRLYELADFDEKKFRDIREEKLKSSINNINSQFRGIPSKDRNLIKNYIFNKGENRQVSFGFTCWEVVSYQELLKPFAEEFSEFAEDNNYFEKIEQEISNIERDKLIKRLDIGGAVKNRDFNEVRKLESEFDLLQRRRASLFKDTLQRPLNRLRRTEEEFRFNIHNLEWSIANKLIQNYYSKFSNQKKIDQKRYLKDRLNKNPAKIYKRKKAQQWSRIGSFVEEVENEDREFLFITLTAPINIKNNVLSQILNNYTNMEIALQRIGRLRTVKSSYKMFVYEATKNLNPHIHFMIAPKNRDDIPKLAKQIFDIALVSGLGRTHIVTGFNSIIKFKNEFGATKKTSNSKSDIYIHNEDEQHILEARRVDTVQGAVQYISKYASKQIGDEDDEDLEEEEVEEKFGAVKRRRWKNRSRESWYGYFLMDLFNYFGKRRKRKVRLIRHSQLFVSQKIVNLIWKLSNKGKINTKKENLSQNGFLKSTKILKNSNIKGNSLTKKGIPSSATKTLIYDKHRDEFIAYDRKLNRLYNSISDINKRISRFASLFKITYKEAQKRVWALISPIGVKARKKVDSLNILKEPYRTFEKKCRKLANELNVKNDYRLKKLIRLSEEIFEPIFFDGFADVLILKKNQSTLSDKDFEIELYQEDEEAKKIFEPDYDFDDVFIPLI